MLSRVAEHIYWLSRYVERAENTARIVTVNANLLLDLPKGIAPGWRPLVDITGSNALFEEHYSDYGELQVVRFLIGDERNSGSILSALVAARVPLAGEDVGGASGRTVSLDVATGVFVVRSVRGGERVV